MVVITTVLDEGSGRLQAAWMERGINGVEMQIVEGSIRSWGEVLFANIREVGPDEEPLYLWLVLDKSADHFTVWSPDPVQFRVWVSQGRVPGTEIDDGVALGELKPEHLEMFIDPSTKLMDWKDPGVFIRVGD